MTVIAAIAYGGTVWMGGDSAPTSSSRQTITLHPGAKVFTRGPYVFGICGSPRMGQLLRYSLAIPADLPEPAGLAEFMATTFIERARTCFKDAGWSTVSNGAERGGQFLVGVAGHLFEVCADYQAVEHAPVARHDEPYAAIGDGAPYALGSLHTTDATRKPLDPEERLRLALAASAQFSPSVREPFTVLSVTTPAVEEAA